MIGLGPGLVIRTASVTRAPCGAEVEPVIAIARSEAVGAKTCTAPLDNPAGKWAPGSPATTRPPCTATDAPNRASWPAPSPSRRDERVQAPATHSKRCTAPAPKLEPRRADGEPRAVEGDRGAEVLAVGVRRRLEQGLFGPSAAGGAEDVDGSHPVGVSACPVGRAHENVGFGEGHGLAEVARGAGRRGHQALHLPPGAGREREDAGRAGGGGPGHGDRARRGHGEGRAEAALAMPAETTFCREHPDAPRLLERVHRTRSRPGRGAGSADEQTRAPQRDRGPELGISAGRGVGLAPAPRPATRCRPCA